MDGGAGERRGRLGERARLLAAVVCGLVAGISCMSIGIGNKTVDPSAGGTLKQQGEFNLLDSPQGTVDVYYPRPYASPPNLRLSGNDLVHTVADCIEIVEQKPDHFTLRRKGSGPLLFPADKHFTWHAEGLPAGMLPYPPPPDAPPVVPTGVK